MPVALLADPDQLARRRFELVDRRELFDRLVRGGFPELVDASTPHVARWYRNYVRTVVERDIVEASAIVQADEMPMLLRLLAANASGEMVAARLAGDARRAVRSVTPRWLAPIADGPENAVAGHSVATGMSL